MVEDSILENKKNNDIHPTLKKSFVILAIVSYALGAVVSIYTIRKLTK